MPHNLNLYPKPLSPTGQDWVITNTIPSGSSFSCFCNILHGPKPLYYPEPLNHKPLNPKPYKPLNPRSVEQAVFGERGLLHYPKP